MKILHMHTTLKSGGIEAMVCHLANEMVKRNEVSFCSIFELTEEDVFLKRLDKRVKVKSLHKMSPGVSLSMLWKIYKFIKKENYPIVQLHGFFYYYFIAILLLHNRCKFFYTVHNDAQRENVKWDKRLFFFKKLFFKRGWMTPITISKESKRSFDELYGMSAPMVYNGTVRPHSEPIDISKYRYTPNTKVLINPGRICEQKNQVMLCQNCDRLIKEGYDLVLLIAGVNQDETILNEMSKYFNERIIYLGVRSDVVNIMASCDALCLSSKWEGMPVVLLEALAVGCVPICTPVGGNAEIVENGKTGFLSLSCSAEDYYCSLKKYMETPDEELKRISKTVVKLFDDFDIQKTALSYEKLYRE